MAENQQAEECRQTPRLRRVLQSAVAILGALALTFGSATIAAATDLPDDGGIVTTGEATPQPPDSPQGDQGSDGQGTDGQGSEGEGSTDPALTPGSDPTDDATDDPADTGEADEGDESGSEGAPLGALLLGSMDTESAGAQSKTRSEGGWDECDSDERVMRSVAGDIQSFNGDSEGQQNGHDECEKPVPGISVEVDQCTVPGGMPADYVWVYLDNLVEGKRYIVTITYQGDKVSSQKLIADGPTAALALAIAGPGDAYTATVMEKRSESSSHTEFEVDPCPPLPDLTITGAADQCVASGGAGTAIVTVGGLLSDSIYTVELWFGDELIGSETLEHPETPGAHLTFPVYVFGEYTAHISGEAVIPDMEVSTVAVRQWESEGDEYPVPVQESASVVFEAGQGCPVPATPVVLRTTPPVLAATGSDLPFSALLAGGALLALGGALVLTQRVRRSHSSR